jgi:GNAT superfamily N-acetyltransferase
MIRKATAADVPAVLGLVRVLADYERAPHEVTLTEAQMQADVHAGHFDAWLAWTPDRQPVGLVLCHRRYSTWKGLTAHLEDLVVLESFRGHGLGRRLLEVAVVWARSIGAHRLHWEVLDWNQPAIDFYEGIGAELNRDWIPCRLAGDALTNFELRYPPVL